MWYNRKIQEFLDTKFCFDKEEVVYFGNIVEEIKQQFRIIGECFNVNEKTLVGEVKKCFPGSLPFTNASNEYLLVSMMYT